MRALPVLGATCLTRSQRLWLRAATSVAVGSGLNDRNRAFARIRGRARMKDDG